MRLCYLAFSAEGEALAQMFSEKLGGTVTRCRENLDISTQNAFASCDGLVFVGATGIAVRAIAPYLQSKTTDPAVVVVDRCGKYVIPLVSGHLGGANSLAKRLASLCGGEAILTTATDLHGVFAVDTWARCQGLRIQNPHRIKNISSRILNGETLSLWSVYPIIGEVPAFIRLVDQPPCDIEVSVTPKSDALWLIPPALVLGVGCRRSVCAAKIEDVFSRFLKKTGFSPLAFSKIASIEHKKEEAGLLAFAAAHALPVCFFSAKDLAALPGHFSASPFVQKTVGVDNVCERSAVCAAQGPLVCSKWAQDGVTFACASLPISLDWRTEL